MNKLACLLIFCSLNVNSQTLKSLQAEADAYQKCLDKGENMKGCAENYYTLADHHLNTVYKKLMTKLTGTEKLQLKEEQRKWLKKRDTEFKKIHREANEVFNCGYMCQDYLMAVANNEADFVLERVKVLIKLFDRLKQEDYTNR